MRVLYIDIETTGLSPQNDQILEIGAILDTIPSDGSPLVPLNNLPRFHTYVKHDALKGNAIALAMNVEILKKMNNKDFAGSFKTPTEVAPALHDWLKHYWGDPAESITIGGKNVGNFDLKFLAKLPNFDDRDGTLMLSDTIICPEEAKFRFSHRVVDPAMLFWNPRKDNKLPSLSNCYRRADLTMEVAHTAIEDALGVAQLIRHYYKLNG